MYGCLYVFFYAKYSANSLRASVLRAGRGKLPLPALIPLVGPTNLQILATPLSSTESVVASFKNLRQPQKLAVVQLSLTSCGLLLCSPKTLCRLCAHIHIVLRHKKPLQQQFCWTSQHWDLWDFKPVCKAFIKLTYFALACEFYEALLGLLNHVKKSL